jgi:zinc transport system substrate-binding protein
MSRIILRAIPTTAAELGRRSLRLTSAFAALLLVAGAMAACGSDGPDATDGNMAVVASFYPLYEAAVSVGGDRVAVTNLTPAGVEPHDLELSPDQVDALLDASVVLYLGQDFQPAVQAIAEQRDQGALDLLAGLDLQSAGPGAEEPGVDPHVWLDPVLMAEIVDAVRAEFSKVDPQGEATYRTNADAYQAEIDALDGRYRDGLSDCARDLIVTSHAAFGYLAREYGLRQEAIAGIEPSAEPDPQRLAELADLVQREGVTTIFTEELVSPAVAETLARETGARTAVLNPLEGLTEAEVAAGATYVSVMDDNLDTLSDALGCP